MAVIAGYDRDVIKATLAFKGYSQKNIAKELGCSEGYISKLLRGAEMLKSERVETRLVNLLQPELEQMVKIKRAV